MLTVYVDWNFETIPFVFWFSVSNKKPMGNRKPKRSCGSWCCQTSSHCEQGQYHGNVSQHTTVASSHKPFAIRETYRRNFSNLEEQISCEPVGKLTDENFLILKNKFPANRLGWINWKCKFAENGKKTANQDAISSSFWQSWAKKRNTAFCNRMFLTGLVNLHLNLERADHAVGNLDDEKWLANWLSFMFGCICVTCGSCDEKRIDKFCSRIYHWLSLRGGWLFVLGKTFLSGTSYDMSEGQSLGSHVKNHGTCYFEIQKRRCLRRKLRILTAWSTKLHKLRALSWPLWCTAAFRESAYTFWLTSSSLFWLCLFHGSVAWATPAECQVNDHIFRSIQTRSC